MIKKTKKCSKCGRILPISDFSNNKATKDGLQYYCKECYNGYRQTHKEHYNQYQKKYQQTHSQYLKEYHKQYYQTNKQHRNEYQKQYNNQYYKQFKGCYLYIILDKQGNVAYIGQTTNYYTRLMKHLSKDVNATKDLFDSGNWSCIKYLDVSNLVSNEMELKALENELIELYQPRLNTVKNIIRDLDNDRLFNLIAELHNALNEWIVFKTNI